jgi:hypothetical protein
MGAEPEPAEEDVEEATVGCVAIGSLSSEQAAPTRTTPAAISKASDFCVRTPVGGCNLSIVFLYIIATNQHTVRYVTFVISFRLITKLCRQ